jgi:hypothetical protein
MSFVNSTPELPIAAASDLVDIGSTNRGGRCPDDGVMAAAADVVKQRR